MKKQFAIVVSKFNQNITQELLSGAYNELLSSGIKKENIIVKEVPGAVEIPLIAQILARSNSYQAIICLGAVIKGETGHYDFVCKQVSDGCQKVMLENNLPVIFGVLTTNNMSEAIERIGGKHGHKGKEAAQSALTMVNLISDLNA